MRCAIRGGGVTVLAAALLSCTSCSWILVKQPPLVPIASPLPTGCTSSVAAPVVDTNIAALFGALGIVSFGAFLGVSPGCHSLQDCDTAVLASAGIAAASMALATTYGLSAAYGFSSTESCRDLREAQVSCLTGVEAACRFLKGGTGELPPGPGEP